MRIRSFCILLLALFALNIPVNALDQAYKLHVPTGDEYLALASEFSGGESAPANVLSQEIIRHYWTGKLNADYHNLSQIYHYLYQISEYFVDQRAWNQLLIVQWLKENPIDLDVITQIDLENPVTVTPRDFDGDGTHEWLLFVPDRNYAILTRDSKNEYQFVDIPLPWFDNSFTYWAFQSGRSEEIRFDDINADGKPEWVVAVGELGGNHSNHVLLFIFQLQGNRLVDLKSAEEAFDSPKTLSASSPAGGGGMPLVPYGVEIQFEDADGDPALEIQFEQQSWDNWGCEWFNTRTFDWNGNYYQFAHSEDDYLDIRGCAWREAEAAMWKGDLSTAIQAYERGLTLPEGPNWREHLSSEEQTETDFYIRARLVIAYTLSGQVEKANKLLAQLEQEAPPNLRLQQLIDALRGRTFDPIALCLAAYKAFDQQCTPNTDGCFYGAFGMLTLIGTTLDNYGPPPGMSLGLPSPIQTACDVSIPLLAQLTSQPLATAQPPVEQLRRLGYQTTTAVHTDLNRDGSSEWLIWLDLPVPTLFLAPDKSKHDYESSFVDVPQPGSKILIQTWPLPDDAGDTLITNDLEGWRNFYYSCPPEITASGSIRVSYARQVLTLWRMQEQQLLPMLDVPLCEYRVLSEVFIEGKPSRKIAGWGKTDQFEGNAPATFVWDSEERNYVVHEVNFLSDVPTHDTSSPANIFWNGLDSLTELDDAETALQAADQGLAVRELTQEWRPPLHYLRALALEALERPEEALAEYMAIYETEPESAWGKLAALHLERVES